MNRPIGQVGQGDSIRDWYYSIPIITRTLLTSTLLLGAAISFEYIQPVDVIFESYFILKKFHIWRLYTPFIFAGKFSFSFLIHTIVLYENCRKYEENPFNTGAGGTSADFLWLLFFGILLLSVFAWYLGIPILSDCLLYLIMYLRSRREPDSLLNFYGFTFKALYWPWINLGIRLIMGGSIFLPLVGIAVGYLYYFLIEVLPNTHNIDIIRTPRFCINFIAYVTGVTPPPIRQPGFIPREQAQAPARFANLGGGHNWGQGRQLGTR